MSSPVKTNETEKSKKLLRKHQQGNVETTENFKKYQGRLNLHKNGTEIYECREKVQGHYQIYIPRISLLDEKITYRTHKRTMHGGVILKMVVIREKYWIPKLRQIPKRVIRKFFGCKKFHTKPFTTQQKGILPSDRTTDQNLFK